MINEKKFCKNCGQMLEVKSIPFMAKTYVELEDGYYCVECGREIIRRRREKVK